MQLEVQDGNIYQWMWNKEKTYWGVDSSELTGKNSVKTHFKGHLNKKKCRLVLCYPQLPNLSPKEQGGMKQEDETESNRKGEKERQKRRDIKTTTTTNPAL